MKQKKDKRITIRLTPEQYDAIQAKAEIAQMSVGTYVRTASLRHRVVVVDGLQEFTHELKGIGQNSNQLVDTEQHGQDQGRPSGRNVAGSRKNLSGIAGAGRTGGPLMATVTFIKYQKQSAGTLHGVARYVSQKQKTAQEDGQQLVSGQNCTPQLAAQEFLATRQIHWKDGPVWFYHYVQSFSPEENITGALAHQTAREVAQLRAAVRQAGRKRSLSHCPVWIRRCPCWPGWRCSCWGP